VSEAFDGGLLFYQVQQRVLLASSSLSAFRSTSDSTTCPAPDNVFSQLPIKN
jgi:hypothetical protein